MAAARTVRPGRPETVGLAVAAAAVAWSLFVGYRLDANPWPLVATLTASVAALLVADRVTRRAKLAVPLILALLPFAVALTARRTLLDDGPLGYSNASGALYLLAAAAAVTVGLRATSSRGRRTAAVLALFWAVLVLLVNAQTVAVFTGLLVIVLFVRSPRAVRRAVVAGGGAALLTLVTTVALGLGYVAWLRTEVLFRVVDSSLGQVRVALWHDALEQIATRPLFGTGPRRFRADSVALDEWAATVHNEFLQVTAETGLVGGVLVLALLGWVFARLWTTRLDVSALPAVVALAGITVQANIDFTWQSPLVPVAGAALAGAALGYRTEGEPERTPIARRHPAAAATVAYAVVLSAVLLWPSGHLNPPYTETNGVEWGDDGLRFVDDGIVYSRAAPEALYRRLTADTGLGIEAWAATAGLDQDGPARLVSSSGEVRHRNFTLAQDRDALVLRLRTTETTLNGTPPVVRVRGVFDDTDLHHLVVTHDDDQVHVWVDGERRASVPSPGGTFAEWVFSYPLLLGNEGDGERPWHGRLAAVALYDRPLSHMEVRQRFLAGPEAAGGADAVAWYPFVGSGSGDVSDRSGSGLGPDLVTPERREAVPPGFIPTVLDTEQALRFAAAAPDGHVGLAASVRVLGHLALFAVLAGLVVRAAPEPRHVLKVALGVGAPLAVAAVVSVVRFTAGRSASLVDVAAAAVGGLLGVGLVAAWQYRAQRRRPEADLAPRRTPAAAR